MENQYSGEAYNQIKYGLLRPLSSYGMTPFALCPLPEDCTKRPSHYLTKFALGPQRAGSVYQSERMTNGSLDGFAAVVSVHIALGSQG